MSGSIVNLVSKGIQDVYITGNPEVSFFRQQFKRHTSFAFRHGRIPYSGGWTNDSELILKIPVRGDLLNYVWIDTSSWIAPPPFGGIGVYGLSPYDDGDVSYSLYIGGQLVDRMDGYYNGVLYPKYLLDKGSKSLNLFNAPMFKFMNVEAPYNAPMVPISFSFFDACPLPLVALQYHEVEIRIKLNSNATEYNTAYGTVPDIYACYTLLDTEERDWFASTPHELLFSQVQKIPMTLGDATNPAFDLSLLNHPVKAIMFGGTKTDSVAEPYKFKDAQIYLNGTALFDDPMPQVFFATTQPYFHGGEISLTGNEDGTAGIYSFALDAAKNYPTGSCNFSRLDNASMIFRDWTIDFSGLTGDTAYVYAVNWNIFRVESGMGGVAFAN